jgi:cytochrome c2
MNRSLYLIPLLLLALWACSCSKVEEKDKAPQGRKSIPFPERLTGEPLFNEYCRSCHKVRGKGGSMGPDLTDVAQRRDPRFIEQAIREPSTLFPGTVMPPYDRFSKKEIDSLVDYLWSLK